MSNLFHKYQQGILIFITIVVILGFGILWNNQQISRGGIGGANDVAKIYGRGITDLDVQRTVHKFQIARELGLNELLRALVGTAENQQQALENFVWNSYVFDHEADALQIFPTDDEVLAELMKVPGFQTDGRYDPAKDQSFVQDQLPALGFSDTVIDELVREQVRVEKVTALIGATVVLTPAEVSNRFQEENEKMDLSVIRLNTSDVEKGITVSDEDAKKIYDANTGGYHTDEQRKVTIASFELDPAQQQLKGRERTAALQALSNKVSDFNQAVVEKGSDFAGQAKKFGATLSTTALFTEAQPDPAYSKIPALAATAFKLTPDLPVSDYVEGMNGYYVLHLDQIVPGAPLTFDQAKPRIIDQIKAERAAQLMQTMATNVRTRLLASVKDGKSIADAAKAAGLTVESVPPFTLMDLSKLDIPDAQSITQSAISLGDKQLGDFVQTANGGLFVYMNSRQAPDPATAGMGESLMKDEYAQQKQLGAFFEWMRIRKEAAKLEVVQR